MSLSRYTCIRAVIKFLVTCSVISHPYRSFSLSRNKKSHPVEKAMKLWCYKRYLNETLLQILVMCVSPNFRYSTKCFADIYRAQYENAMLVYLRGTPIWRPENSVSIWNLLWLSRWLIISTDQTSIYISTFHNALTSKKAQSHEISIYFSTNSIVSLVSCTSIMLKFKMLWIPNKARYWAVKL